MEAKPKHVVHFLTGTGDPFDEWMESLKDATAFSKINIRLEERRSRQFRRSRPRRAWSFIVERALWPGLPDLLRPGWRYSDFVDRRDQENAAQGHRESERSLEGIRTCLRECCLTEPEITSPGCLRSSPIHGEPPTTSIPPSKTPRKCFLRPFAMSLRRVR